MMNFLIKALQRSGFEHLFGQSDTELANQQILRMCVEDCPGSPCRVSLEDARVGESVLLLNYQHLPEHSPYQSSHAIFIRENAVDAELGVNEVPESIRGRLLSLRMFNDRHLMIDADAVTGDTLGQTVSRLFEHPQASYIHIHNAKPGCFAARLDRVN